MQASGGGRQEQGCEMPETVSLHPHMALVHAASRGCVPEGLLLFRELREEGVGKHKVGQVHLACD